MHAPPKCVVASVLLLACGGESVTPPVSSVVPQGEIVGTISEAGQAKIVAMNLDGSNRRTLALVADAGDGARSTWIPGTNSVVFVTVEEEHQTLRTVDQNGTVKPFFASPTPSFVDVFDPIPTRDGQWLYFSVRDTVHCGGFGYCLCRAPMDGKRSELLAIVSPLGVIWQPFPSPNGSRLAFAELTRVGNTYVSSIKVLDVTTWTVAPYNVQGQDPAWSPSDKFIAYYHSYGAVGVMNADGTGAHDLPRQAAFILDGPVAWSPDEKWILTLSRRATDVFNLHSAIVNAATGEVIELPYLVFGASFR